MKLHREYQKKAHHVSIRGYLMAVALILFCFFSNGQVSYQFSTTDTAYNKPIGRTIPYVLPWDDMPIDLSFVYEQEKPAGKRGFLQIKGEKFVFEDGTEARFWGTNFNSAQNFPSHEHSEKVAKRLAKVGVNLVRFHQMDAEWSTPNIFSFSAGKNNPNTLRFDAESMDRLDYLIHCLKEEGIYVYMDLFTYRRFREGDGVDSVSRLADAAKPYSTYNRKLIELQKQFNEQLWNHVNPYTKLAYKDDPVIVLTGITNENDFWSQEVVLEPYRSELESLYRKWAAENGVKIGKEQVVFESRKRTDADMQRFYIDITQDYYQEMIGHMRDIGVKVPISGTNWTRNIAHLSAQTVGDFTDSHRYYYSFSLWGDGTQRFTNHPMTGSKNNMIPHLAYYSVQDKPFFVSEWDHPWPSDWRAESPLFLAAVGSMQGWGGFAIHTYRYTLDEDVDMLAKPALTKEAINNRYHRAGTFDTFNDPAKFGLFYHAALITRRGDVRLAEKTVNIIPKDIFSTVNTEEGALSLTVEKHRTKTVLPEQQAKGDIQINIDDTYVNGSEVLSDTEELYRNLDKKIGWINSPMTKAVYGFVGREDGIKLGDVDIDVKTDFATVAISSLTEDPINSSTNMLLTAVGRAENTGMKFSEARNQLLEVGHGPVLVEVIDAMIKIKTDRENLRVMSIDPKGMIRAYIPSEYKDGVFSFEIGQEFESMYYLIQAL